VVGEYEVAGEGGGDRSVPDEQGWFVVPVEQRAVGHHQVDLRGRDPRRAVGGEGGGEDPGAELVGHHLAAGAVLVGVDGGAGRGLVQGGVAGDAFGGGQQAAR
jgi:hypothetical protein